MSNYNKTYPECPPDYVLYSIIHVPQEPREVPDDEMLPFTSLIKGTQAFDDEGNIIPNAYPVFISIAEAKENNLDLEDPTGVDDMMAQLG